jgi:hypothetical protein
MNDNIVKRGDRITVVRGKKVPLNTSGVVFWVGVGQYGERVGFKAGDVTHWTATKNIELSDAPAAVPAEAPAPMLPFTAPEAEATPAVVRGRDLLAKLAALEARIAVLEAVDGKVAA